VGVEPVKKGRHRRFEEARRLKQSGPSAEDLGLSGDKDRKKQGEEDFEDIARRYGVEFDENGEVVAEDDA
jgi:hypothetical protein